MASPTFNNAIWGETFLPGQIFVFGSFALRANSLGHLEQIDSYAPGHQVRFGNLNYMADIRGNLIFDGFRLTPGSAEQSRLARLRPAVRQYLGYRTCNSSGSKSGADRVVRGRVDGPRPGGRILIDIVAEHRLRY